ncbi:MAG: hypothetical protein GQ550_08150 [Gammaproteobacteria bacterium]|nr:hypothetical protein [Gammaproteobacteria bacterium]
MLALILVLPLADCTGGDGGLASGSGVVNLSWVAPSEREDGTALALSEIAGFRIYYGTVSGDYQNHLDVNDSSAVQAQVAGVPSGTYYVVLTTVDADGRESSYSNELVVTL